MIKVLIADDFEIVRVLMCYALKKGGDMKVVAMASNGQEAVKEKQYLMKKLDKNVQKTIMLVQKLAAYRDEYLSIKRSSPRFERSCQIMGITPETVKRHVPELVENWYDSKYHWSTISKNAPATPSDAEISSKR